MILFNKKVLVYGLKESGLGAIKLLKKHKAKVYCYDDNKENFSNLPNFCDDIVKVEAITENLLSFIDLIVVSPSISLTNKNLILAQILGKKIISEIELAYLFKKGKIISVTGSNGKSTTVSLIYHILCHAGKKTSLVGNIGNSFAKEVSLSKRKTYVVEVSSFQLEASQKYRSNIACFLNFCENHLDRHFSLAEYFNAKKKLFDNQKSSDFAVLNFDEEKIKNIKTKAKKFYFSLKNKVKGAFLDGGKIYFNNGVCEEVLTLSSIKLKGEHNIQNVLCAVVACKLFGISNEQIKGGVETFFGLSHRIEFVDNIDGISFYNDSKSTTTKSTLTALNCFENNNVLLILGGSDKNCDFSNLFPINSCVKKIFAIGKTKDKIMLCAKQNGFLNVEVFDNFKFMVEASLNFAKAENLNVVLLSPATASFDMFKNFEERGDVFKNCVKELKSEK